MTKLTLSHNKDIITTTVSFDISQQISEMTAFDIARLVANHRDIQLFYDDTLVSYLVKNNNGLTKQQKENILYALPPDAMIDFSSPELAGIIEGIRGPEFVGEIVSNLNMLGEEQIFNDAKKEDEVIVSIAKAIPYFCTHYPDTTVMASIYIGDNSSIETNIFSTIMNASDAEILLLSKELNINSKNNRECDFDYKGVGILTSIATKDSSAMGRPFVDICDTMPSSLHDRELCVGIELKNPSEFISTIANFRPDVHEYLKLNDIDIIDIYNKDRSRNKKMQLSI